MQHGQRLRQQIEDFLYLEAELLDSAAARMADFSPTTRVIGRRSATTAGAAGRLVRGVIQAGRELLFQRHQQTLKIRVERVYSKQAWAEVPPSRTRRLISNVRVKKDDGREIEVHSNFLVYRTRMEKDEDIFVGTRKDILRRVNGEIKIARRTIILDQAVLGAKNISIFL